MKKENKKERLEEVNIMQGIDFKSNQARMREQAKRLQREQRKERVLAFFIGAVIVIMTCTLLNYMNNGSLEKCEKAGNSKEYCMVKL